MLQSEFENHTGIYPDVLTYEAAEHEYNEEKWKDKEQFCRAFESNENGLAEKIQRIANKRWFDMEEKNGALSKELNELTLRVDALTDLREAMFNVEDKMAGEFEFSRRDIGTVHIGFNLLLQELGVI